MTDLMSAHVLGPKDGRAGMLGSMGVRFMIAGEETGFGVVALLRTEVDRHGGTLRVEGGVHPRNRL